MKIAITGGAGFVGSHLTRAYLDAGHDVLVIDSLVNGPRCAVDPRARLYRVDIRDEALHTVLLRERPDLVSHHAMPAVRRVSEEQALCDGRAYLRGLLNLLEGCVGAAVKKLILASNGTTLYRPIPLSEYAQSDSPAIGEGAALCPQRPADISKVAGEWYVRYYHQHYGLEYTILRYADIFGGSGGHPSADIIEMLANHQRPTIHGSGQDIRDHIYIDDVVGANLHAVDRGHNCTLHISSGRGYTLGQFFCAIAQGLSSALLPVFGCTSQAEPTALVLDNARARRELGWRPEVSLGEGIGRMIEEFRLRRLGDWHHACEYS